MALTWCWLQKQRCVSVPTCPAWGWFCVVPVAGLGHDAAASHCCSVSWRCLLCRASPGFGIWFLLWVILLLWLWLCLADLPSPAPSSACFHLSLSLPWPCLHWSSRQASSGSWASWKWGICPFFPLPTLFPYGCFWTEGALVPDYTQLVGICSIRQPGAGSSFQPYLALHSSACPYQNCMWWPGNPGSESEMFFTFPTVSIPTVISFFSGTGSPTGVAWRIQNFSACNQCQMFRLMTL